MTESAELHTALKYYPRTLEGEILHLETLVRAALATDYRSVRDQWIVDARVRDKIGLELGQIDIECTIEPQAGCDGAHYLSNQTIEMLVSGTRNIQVASADIVHGVVVD